MKKAVVVVTHKGKFSHGQKKKNKFACTVTYFFCRNTILFKIENRFKISLGSWYKSRCMRRGTILSTEHGVEDWISLRDSHEPERQGGVGCDFSSLVESSACNLDPRKPILTRNSASISDFSNLKWYRIVWDVHFWHLKEAYNLGGGGAQVL